MKLFFVFLNNNAAQSSLEYGLIVSLTFVSIISAYLNLSGSTGKLYNVLAGIANYLVN